MQYKSELSKGDLIWGYVAKLVGLGSGIIVLPLVLHLLDENEIAMNYIMHNLMGFVVLFDIGFSNQFARNFAFIYGGAQEITKEGTPTNISNHINYELLYRIIKSAKKFYGIMSIVLAIALITGGSAYVYKFTDGFTVVNNALEVWIAFSASIVLDFYFRYYNPLLRGQGKIAAMNKIEAITTIIRIFLVMGLLLSGFGLWSIAISNFVRILIARLWYVKIFYTEHIKAVFATFKNDHYNDLDIIRVLWFNAKKSMIVSLATLACTQFSLFYSGLYLEKATVAGYGILLQFVNIISGLGSTVNNNLTSVFSTLRTVGDYEKIRKNLFFAMGIMYCFYIVGASTVIFLGPPILQLIGSNAVLPSILIMFLAFLYRFLQDQHCVCSIYLTTQNKIVDFESSIIVGVLATVLPLLFLKFTDLGLIGVILGQIIAQLVYPNWKWPYEVCKEFKISYPRLVYNSFSTTFRMGREYLKQLIINKR